MFVEMVLLIAEWMSPVDTSQSVRWLFPSGAVLRALFSMRERIIYGSVLSRVTLGRLFSLSLATRFSSLSSEGGCRGNEMMAV